MTAAKTTSARKTLVFHIGDHKTGSTSIQYAFAQNRVKLSDASVFYPARLAFNVMRKHCEAYADPEATPANRNTAIEAFRKLGKRLQASEADYCLISAEGFETIPAEVFKEILTRYWATPNDRVRVIAYVRPHPGRVLSSYAERAKIGVPLALQETVDAFFQKMNKTGRFHYFTRFSAWKEQFGDAFILRPTIREQLLDGSVVRDFIHQAFDQRDFELQGGDSANESLCLEDLMRLKVVQSHLHQFPHSLRHTFGWEFARLIGELPPPPTRTKLRLHKRLATDIRKTYLEDARQIDKAFFDGVPLLEEELDKAVASADESAQSTAPEDHLSEEDLRSLTVMSAMLSKLFRNDGQNWASFLHNQRVQALLSPSPAATTKKPGRKGKKKKRGAKNSA